MEPVGKGPGVYVHVPWCRRRCPYCDFYFEVGRPGVGFAAKVAEELGARRGEAGEGPARTLYFGGGTPSLLPAEEIAGVLEAVGGDLGLAREAEITLEANPEDLDEGAIAAFAEAGVGRLSLGAQAFDDEALRYLGRAHDGARARSVVEAAARRLRVSVDLIGGLPGEPPGRLLDDIDTAASLGAGQVSAYLLTVEQGTPLARRIERGQSADVADDEQAEVYARAAERLLGLGYRHVEVSSWSRPKEEPLHNRLYWQGVPYLGLGPGAHSMRGAAGGGVVRRHTTARLGAWLKDPAGAAFEEEHLEPELALKEAVAFGLRDMLEGVDLSALSARHHTPVPGGVLSALERGRESGLLARGPGGPEDEGARLFLTEKGALFADAVARDVLYE